MYSTYLQENTLIHNELTQNSNTPKFVVPFQTFVTTDEMKSHECRPRGSNANYPKCPICLKYLSNTWSLSRHMKTHKRDGSAGGGKLDGSKSGSDDGSKTGFGEEDSKGFEKSGGDTTGEEGGPDDDDHHSNQMMHHHPEFVLKNPRVILEKLSLTQLQGELHNHQLHQQSNRLVADERTKSSEDLSLGEEASGGGNLASGFSSEECDKNGDSFGIAEQQGVGSTAVAMMEKCQVCGKEFKNRTYLYKHLKSVHTAKVMKPSLGSDEGGCSSGAGNGDDMQLEKDPLDNAPVRPDTAKALASKFNKKFNGKMDSPTGGGPSGHIMDNNNNNNGSGADYLVPLSNSNPNQININTSGNSITIISNVTYCNTQHDVPINAGGMMGSGGDGKGDPILDRRMTDPKYDMLGQMQYGPLDPMNQKPLEMAKYDDVDPNQQKMLEPTPFVIQKLKKEVVVHSMENQYGEPSGSFSDEKLSSAQMEMKPLVDPLLESYSIKKEEHNPEQETAVMDSKKIFNFHDMEMLKSNIKEEEMGNEHKYEPSDYSQQTMSSPVKSKDMLLGFDDHPDLGDEDHESNSKPDMSLDMKCENLEEKAHPCDECGKCFAKRSQLTRHKNIHKNIIYICPFCQREPFKARNSLKNHLKTNHKEMNDKWGDPAYISAQVIKDPEKVEEYLKNWNERTKPNVNGSNSSKPGPSKSSAISPAIENPADLKMNLGAHNLSSSYEKAIPIDHGNIIPGMPAGHGSGSKKKKKGSKQEANIGENYTIPELDNDLSVGIKGVVKQEFEAGTAPVGGSTSGGYYQYGGCNPAGFNSYQTQPSAYGSMASHSEYGNYQQQPSHTGIPASTSALPFQGYPSSTANYTQNGPYQQHSVPSAAPPQPPPAQQSQHQYAQSNPSPAARTPGNINNPMSPPISPHLQQQQAAQDFYSDQGATSSRGSNPGRVNYSSSAASAYHHQHQYYMQNLNHHSPDNNSYPYPANPQIQSSYAHSHGHSSFPGGNSSASNSSTAPHPYHSSSQSHTIPPTPPPSASSFSSSSSSHHPAKPLVGMPPSVPSLHQHHHNYGQYESVSASKRPRIDRYYPPNQPLPPASYPMEQAMGQYQHHQYLQSSGSSSGGSSGPSSSGPGGSTPSGYMGPPAPQ